MDKQEDFNELMRKKLYPGIGTGFLIVLITLIIQFFASFILIFPSISEGVGIFISYTAGLILAIAIARTWVPKHAFRFNGMNWLLMIPIIILSISASILIEPVVKLIPVSDFFYELMERMTGYGIYSFLTVAVAAPILEELLFRGVILEGFLKRYKPWTAILWSALLFGIIHLNPWQFIPAFMIGIIMGWVYYKTRSLVPVILIHFANNSLSYWASVTFGSEVQTVADITGPEAYVQIYALALLLFFGCAFILKKTLGNRESPNWDTQS